MGAFCSKTLNNSSPRGKYRIYLCAHREELSNYIEQISNSILPQYPNCALWYYDETIGEEISQEAFTENLSQMRLFVVPVTKKFLAGGNPALDIEFRYAREHNSPTLLLLQEENLVNQFNDICGKLHFIKESDEKYDEKIQRFMTLLFADDKLIKKIKGSFDAKIFLSYRKIDRKHAKRLIDMIHQSFRNVAIWFDDYLTSGEKFDVEIRAAIKNSDLIAMVITPNILNTPNYVEKKEYPLAKNTYHKSVLPVELERTDKQRLSGVLCEIDECIDISDEAALIRALKNELGKYSGNKKLTGDEKDYLIGLAYLMGIQVERDAAVGFELILQAAEAGNHEAMNKLYQMYRIGDYVDEDYKEAIIWKMKSIRELCNLRYGARYSYQKKKFGLEYIYSCLELIDYKNELIQDYSLYDTLDEDFLFVSQGFTETGESMVDIFTSDLSRIEGNLALFASLLFERYPSDQMRLALAKCALYQGKSYVESMDDHLIKNASQSFEDALSLLDGVSDRGYEVQILTAEIYTALATLPIAESSRGCAFMLNPTSGNPHIYAWMMDEAQAALEKMRKYSDQAIEILEELRLCDMENITIIHDLCKAYEAKAGACFYDWRINRNIAQKDGYKKYSYYAIEKLKEVITRDETRRNMIALRDSYNSLLYESLYISDFVDLLNDGERKQLFEAIVSIEEKLEVKWNIEKKFTHAPWYHFPE